MLIFVLPYGYVYVVQTGMPTDPVMVGTGHSLAGALGSMTPDRSGRLSATVRSIEDAAEIAAHNDNSVPADKVLAGYTTKYDELAEHMVDAMHDRMTERLFDAMDKHIAERAFVGVIEAVADAWPNDEDGVRVTTEHWQDDHDIPHITVEAAYPQDALTDDEWQAFAEDDAWDAPDGWEIVNSGADGESLAHWYDGVVNTTYVVYAPVLA